MLLLFLDCAILDGMKAFSLDLRERIVGFVKQGGSKAEATRQFKISKWTVYRYIEADREGSLAPKPSGGSPKKFEDDTLRKEVKANSSATLKEYGASIGVSHVAVWRRLRQLAITRKKNACATRKGTTSTGGSSKGSCLR